MSETKSFRAKFGISIFAVGSVWELAIRILDYWGRYLLLKDDALPTYLTFVSHSWVAPSLILIGIGLFVLDWIGSTGPEPKRHPAMSLAVFILAGAAIGGIGGATIWALVRSPAIVQQTLPSNTGHTSSSTSTAQQLPPPNPSGGVSKKPSVAKKTAQAKPPKANQAPAALIPLPSPATSTETNKTVDSAIAQAQHHEPKDTVTATVTPVNPAPANGPALIRIENSKGGEISGLHFDNDKGQLLVITGAENLKMSDITVTNSDNGTSRTPDANESAAIQKLIQEYKDTQQKQSSVEWINRKLKERGYGFQVQVKSTPPQ